MLNSKLRRRLRRLAMGLFGAGALVATAGCAPACGVAAGGDFMAGARFPREVTGRVSGIGSRIVMNHDPKTRSGVEKYALQLSPWKADKAITKLNSTEAGLIECLSTRCATLQPGDCAEFQCAIDGRMMEPNVVQCRVTKSVACPAVWTKE